LQGYFHFAFMPAAPQFSILEKGQGTILI